MHAMLCPIARGYLLNGNLAVLRLHLVIDARQKSEIGLLLLLPESC